uniref:Uncharacterized protein n=1 Tax=Solanum lycopersicum TaxID=4081 RepID=K4AU13_SOLLC
MRSIGMDIDFIDAPMQRHFIVNAKKLVNVRYSRLITYLRSTFVNNECSAQSEVKASMLEHIVHASR